MSYISMCCCEAYGFQAVYSRIGYINQSVWVQNRVSFFRKVITWFKIYVDLGLWYKVLFWLDCASDLSSFWKTAILGQGGLGEFTLVQGSKIQLNQTWYRLRGFRVLAAHPHPEIPKVPPPARARMARHSFAPLRGLLRNHRSKLCVNRSPI